MILDDELLDDEFESMETLLEEIEQQLARVDRLLNEIEEVGLL